MKIAFPVLWLASLALAGCAGEPPASATVGASNAARPAFKIQSFLPDTQSTADSAQAPGSPVQERFNDPSAAPDTPLCGTADRQANEAGAAISPAVMSTANACLQTACFDPLTDTYIGADGFRHVCQ